MGVKVTSHSEEQVDEEQEGVRAQSHLEEVELKALHSLPFLGSDDIEALRW